MREDEFGGARGWVGFERRAGEIKAAGGPRGGGARPFAGAIPEADSGACGVYPLAMAGKLLATVPVRRGHSAAITNGPSTT